MVMAGDIVLDAYVFYLVPQSTFIQAAAVTQAASRLGYVAAAEAGELAIALLGASLTSLFWVSLVAILGAAALTVALPGKSEPPQVRPQRPRSPEQLVQPDTSHSARMPSVVATIAHI